MPNSQPGRFLVGLGVLVLIAMAAPASAATQTVLVDPAQDVAYSAQHTSARDRGHLDVISVEMDAQPEDEVLVLVLDVVDLQDFETKVADFHFTCTLAAEIQVETFPVANLTMRIDKYPGKDNVDSTATLRSGRNSSVLWSSLEMRQTAPGGFRFGLELPPLMNLGEQLGNFYAACSEAHFPAGAIGPSVYVNRDEAKSDTSVMLVAADEAAIGTEAAEPAKFGIVVLSAILAVAAAGIAVIWWTRTE